MRNSRDAMQPCASLGPVVRARGEGGGCATGRVPRDSAPQYERARLQNFTGAPLNFEQRPNFAVAL